VLVSISSGARQSDDSYFNLVYRGSAQISILCFTEAEASSFLRKKEVGLTLERVMHITGTNPFLLSQIVAKDSVETLTYSLRRSVQHVLERNFKELVANATTLSEYFTHNDMLKCISFIKLANRGHLLTKEELSSYSDSLLWSHLLLVVEDSKIEGAEAEAGAETEAKQVLLWNFPILGDMFDDILNNFVGMSTYDELTACCTNTPSFAGFWYEHLFFKDCKDNKVIHIQKDKGKLMNLNVCEVVKLSVVQTQEMQPGVLYTMKANFPVVDAVGLFQQDDSNFLVFFQISLQTYKKHRLCDLFTRIHKYLKLMDCNRICISIFTHYMNLYKTTFNKVLLVYVSPKEIGKQGAQTLQTKIEKTVSQKIQQSITVMGATLANNSSFHQKIRLLPLIFNKLCLYNIVCKDSCCMNIYV